MYYCAADAAGADATGADASGVGVAAAAGADASGVGAATGAAGAEASVADAVVFAEFSLCEHATKAKPATNIANNFFIILNP